MTTAEKRQKRNPANGFTEPKTGLHRVVRETGLESGYVRFTAFRLVPSDRIAEPFSGIGIAFCFIIQHFVS